MNKNSPGSRLLSRAEVAEMFRVSPSTVTRWSDAGMLPTVKTLGGHRRYDAAAVAELVQRCRRRKLRWKNSSSVSPTYGRITTC